MSSLSKMTTTTTTASSGGGGGSTTDDEGGLRRGPWTVEEDTLLIHYISSHGEGRWNLLAKRSGLKRTGKSCRLRWLNYLKPDVKRGNLTPQEQLLILELHSKWGNRWSKIAQHLPGRTDNEIKNYWRTRVQKQARHLKIDPNSNQFQELIRCVWMPRLLQKIHGQSNTSTFWEYYSSSNFGANNNNNQLLCNSLATPVAPPQQEDDDDVDVVLLPYYDPPFPMDKVNSSRRSTSTPCSMSSSNSSAASDQMPFQDMDSHHYYYYNNNSSNNQTESYNVDNTSYDMVETFSSLFTVMGGPNHDPSSASSSSSAYQIYSGDQSNHWFAADEFTYGSLWNMDDLSQFKQR